MRHHLHQPHAHLMEETAQQRKWPAMYEVVLLNDDATPIEFVVLLLETIFHKNEQEAVDITLQTHTEGHGSCGLYTRDVAETKMIGVIDMARVNHFPLKCIMHRN